VPDAARKYDLSCLVSLISSLFRRGRPESGDERVAATEREANKTLADALLRAPDVRATGLLLVEEVVRRLGVDFVAVALISDDRRRASGLVGLQDGAEADWWPEVTIDLEHEPSAVATAAFEAAPIFVYDVAASARVSRRLADRVGAQSAVFVPLISSGRVHAVLVGATTKERRLFAKEEIAALEQLAGEAALAVERAQSSTSLAEALERERIVGEIARKIRSELDLDDVLRVAVEETAQATGAMRAFIRLGEPGEPMPVLAEWDAPGTVPVGGEAPSLPILNLAVRDRRTVAVGDIEDAVELRDPSLGSVDSLRALGAKAVLATPILVFDRVIGVFGLHRSDPHQWTVPEQTLLESVAREVGLAIHTAQLLEENAQRLEQSSALLKASQYVTGELRLETVLQRLVVEVTRLLRADAADCYLYDTRRNLLTCAAVYGLDPDVVSLEFPADRGLAGEALRQGRGLLSTDYKSIDDPVPHAAYASFRSAIVAPVTWSGEKRGVLGVGTRDEQRRFDRDDVAVLETFAGLASIALRHASTFEQSARQARIQRGFYGIASALAEPLSLDETLDAVAQAANEALGGSFAALLMPAGGKLTLAAGHQLPEALARVLGEGLPESSAALSSCARERRMLAASDVVGDDRFEQDWRELAEQAGYRSLLAIPIEAPRREQGGLALVFFAEERTFTDDELELAQHLAGAARGALERSELYETERSSRALSQQLARMGGLLATELDPTAILGEVVEQAPALLGADAASVRRLEDDGLIVSAASGEGAEAAIGSRAPASAWLVGDIVQSRGPKAVADVAGDRRLLDADPILAEGYASYLGVPLFGAEGELYGVLAVYGRGPRPWLQEEIEALAALAGNASAVLANADLYQQVKDEQDRSSAILDNIADGIVAVDREGAVVLWNAAAEAITGVPASEAIGRTPAQVLQRNLESGQPGATRDRLIPIRRGGEDVWLSVSEAVMRDPTGAVAGRIYAFRDVSSERVVEEMKSEFVAAVSHELRTPLTSIYGFAETLLRQDVLFEEDERRTFLGFIASEAQRLTGIVDALLNVARLDAGDLQMELAPIDVRTVVSEVVTGVQESGAVNGHSIVVDLPTEPLDAAADRDKLRQILANLVDNAVKFSPDGGTVTVAARRKSGAVEVRVVDRGPGIPAAERARIFRKFYRGDFARDRPGSTGLGLFIAEGLVRAMGGRIWVDSEEGEGSSFAFELPLAGEQAEAVV
jgi:two-component system phosphate regulon sensor histidine kinase PhoR